MLKVGVVTVSDRVHKGVYEDKGGPKVQELLGGFLVSDYEVVSRVVPDEVDLIKETLINMCDEEGCLFVITTGGTGPCVRDVTPEATTEVCKKILPGFGELMRQVSQEKVPTGILSRQTAGIYNKSLIINLPGSVGGVKDCLSAVMPAVADCLHVVGGIKIKTNESIMPAVIFHG